MGFSQQSFFAGWSQQSCRRFHDRLHLYRTTVLLWLNVSSCCYLVPRPNTFKELEDLTVTAVEKRTTGHQRPWGLAIDHPFVWQLIQGGWTSKGPSAPSIFALDPLPLLSSEDLRSRGNHRPTSKLKSGDSVPIWPHEVSSDPTWEQEPSCVLYKLMILIPDHHSWENPGRSKAKARKSH